VKNTKEWYKQQKVHINQRNSWRIIFSREKIVCLKKLTEVPELWNGTYYSQKSKFIELLGKI
jgi:hypothetical protein